MTATRHVLRPTLAAIALLGAMACMADSDGYYCAGDGYLAWETRGFKSDGQHQLFVITVHGDHGLGPRIAIALPDFQLHGMRCQPSTITMYGFRSAHHIELDAGGAHYIGSSVADDHPAARERYVPRRFGDTPELALHSVGKTVQFALLTTLNAIKFTRGTEFTTLARLVVMDSERNLIDSQAIFAEAVAEHGPHDTEH
jgi:hypothetical protein